jgi:hypothetical protein
MLTNSEYLRGDWNVSAVDDSSPTIEGIGFKWDIVTAYTWISTVLQLSGCRECSPLNRTLREPISRDEVSLRALIKFYILEVETARTLSDS